MSDKSLEAMTYISLFDRLSVSARKEVEKHVLDGLLSIGGVNSVLHHSSPFQFMRKKVVDAFKHNFSDANPDYRVYLTKLIETSTNKQLITDLYMNQSVYDEFPANVEPDWKMCYNDTENNLVVINDYYDRVIDFNLDGLDVRRFDFKKDIVDNDAFSSDKFYILTCAEMKSNPNFHPVNDRIQVIPSGQKAVLFMGHFN